MYLVLKHNLVFHRCRSPLVPQTAQILISRLYSNAGAAFQNAPWKETFTHYFCTCHPEMWWWGWSKWKWQQNWFPHYFPSLTPRYVQVSGQHASQRRGTHFPTLLLLPPRKMRMVQRQLPTPGSFSSGVFVATELLQIHVAYWLTAWPQQQKCATRESQI